MVDIEGYAYAVRKEIETCMDRYEVDATTADKIVTVARERDIKISQVEYVADHDINNVLKDNGYAAIKLDLPF